jgi:drug/metabolite transporter (DMT)-like permease
MDYVNQRKAYFYAGLAILFWSTVASAFKIALRYTDFLSMLLYSSIVSTLTLLFILVIQRKIFLLKNLSLKDYSLSIGLGFLNPFLYYLILFKAYSLLPAQEAQPLNYTWPIMIVLFSIPMLKQKIKVKNVIAILISFLGIIIISTHGRVFDLKFSNLFGVTLALSSSIIWASFWLLNVKDRRDEIIKLFLNFGFGTVFTLIVYLITTNFGYSKISGIHFTELNKILPIVWIGLFEMGLTFVFWLKALKYSETSAKVSNLVYISPFLSLFFIYFIVGEKILISSIMGLILIVGGIILQNYGKK